MKVMAIALTHHFPALDQQVNGHRLVYLDSAATTQKPQRVLDAMDRYYRRDNANVHRGVHELSQRATELFEGARAAIARHIGASQPEEIVLTKGCTEAVNLAAASWGRVTLKEGDVVLCSTMEHHANLVPWQLAAQAAGAKVLPIPISDDGVLLLDEYEGLLKAHPVKLAAIKHVCNALGTVNPIKEAAALAHRHGALIFVDGAQALAHLPVDVQDLGVDFYAMAAHKAYGPMGAGALYARRELLEAMPPYQGGGDMIRFVSFEGTTFNDVPAKFEAGTPNVPAVIGFAEALAFVREYGFAEIHRHEQELLDYGTEVLASIGGLRFTGTAPGKAAILAFVLDGVHPHDAGTVLDRMGVAVRTGHHCCMPLMKRLRVPATIRASLAVYNTKQDIDVLAQGLLKAKELLG